jgi:hypothetical protein
MGPLEAADTAHSDEEEAWDLETALDHVSYWQSTRSDLTQGSKVQSCMTVLLPIVCTVSC